MKVQIYARPECLHCGILPVWNLSVGPTTHTASGAKSKQVKAPTADPAARRRIPGKIPAAFTSLWLILLVALGLRLAYAWDHQSTTPHLALSSVPFLYEAGDIAYSLAVGKGFASPFRVDTGPTAWETPVYPLIVAGVFRIFGTFTFESFVAAVLLNILFSSFACVPIYFVGKRIDGTAVAAAAAWLWAIFPTAIVIPYQWIWDTSLSALLAATILWATLALEGSRRARDWSLYGLLWGFTLMTNGTMAALLPFLLGWLMWRARESGETSSERLAPERGEEWPARPAGGRAKEWLLRPALAAGIMVLCCVPWTVRNYLVFHSFIPLRSVLGLQMWLGNNDQYHDFFPGWLHPIDSPTERAKYVRMGEIAYMREKRQEAVHWMLSHPKREAQLFEQRFIATWLATPHPLRDFLRSRDLLIRAVFVTNLLASLGALGGIAVLYQNPKTRPYAFPIAVYPLVFPIVFYLSQALLRYRYPIDPVVMLLTAVAADALVRRLRGDPKPIGMPSVTPSAPANAPA